MYSICFLNKNAKGGVLFETNISVAIFCVCDRTDSPYNEAFEEKKI